MLDHRARARPTVQHLPVRVTAGGTPMMRLFAAVHHSIAENWSMAVSVRHALRKLLEPAELHWFTWCDPFNDNRQPRRALTGT
jgi:hypothetical protein